MAKITGTQGEIKSGATSVADVTEFSLDETTEMVEDTPLGTLVKTFKTDRTSWAGSMTVMYDKDDAGQDTLLNSASLSATLIPAGDVSGNEEWTGTILITGISMPVAAGAMVTRQVSFQGTGVLAVAAIV